MKRTLLFLCLSVFIVSCGTSDGLTRNERKAQKKLRKAIKWDPNIIAKQTTDTSIKGVATDTVELTMPGFQTETNIDCDSINNALSRMLLASTEDNAALYLYSDSLIDVIVKKGRNGQLSVKTDVKPRTRDSVIMIPYEVKVTVPGKAVYMYKRYPIWKYWQFWLSIVISCVCVCLYVNEARKNKQQINFNLDKKETDASN